MIQRGSGARLLPKATQSLFVPGEVGAQQFERHLATEARILSQEHVTHAAAPDVAQDLITADEFAHDWIFAVIPQNLGSRFNGHCLDRISSLIVGSDERLDFTAKRWI